MFGLFKRKKASGIGDHAHDVLSRTAAMLEMQLFLCRSTEGFERRFEGDFVRGYLIGFFDGAIQHAGLSAEHDQDFFVLLATGHTYLFEGNAAKAAEFVMVSLARQNNRPFSQAQLQGGSEYFDFLADRIANPTGLLRYFHDGVPADA